MRKSSFRIAIAATIMTCAAPIALTSSPVMAQKSGSGVSNLLAGASDNALDKLAQPGAFFADKAVRILLPGPLKKASNLLRFTSKSGLTKDLTKSMNDAASLAAKEAKPIFREAINGLSLTDGVGIATKKNGGTQFLRESSGDSLKAKIRPLVVSAMGETGAFNQLDKLSSAGPVSRLGISSDNLTDHVTDKTMDGIFKYMAAEENKVRKNPLKSLGGIFGKKKK